MVAQLLCGLGLLVFVHELGHFLAARIFGMRVPKFYLFFNPKFSIIKCKKINGKIRFKFFSSNLQDVEHVSDEKGKTVLDAKGKPQCQLIDTEKLPNDDWRKYPENTEYGVGWLPLGGYCQIAGMIDETQSIANMPSDPQAWEYRAKPAWQRLIVILGGVIINMIVGVLLFALIIWHFDKEYLPNAAVTDGIYAFEAAREMGFVSGDKIISVDNQTFERFEDAVSPAMVFGSIVCVERDGKERNIVMNENSYELFKNAQGKKFISISNYAPLIDTVVPNMGAQKAGLQQGDIILSIADTIPINVYGNLLERLPEFASQDIRTTILRGIDTMEQTLSVDSNGMIGMVCKMPYRLQAYSTAEAFKYGWKDAIKNLTLNIKGLGKIISGEEKVSSLSGPIGIAQIYGKAWDWKRFWYITALLSVMLALMNVLPIPGLDGGHALIALFELVTRKKVPDSFLQHAQTVGMILLLLLMIFVIGNDVAKLLF
jgi:regulator of sigma E protease